MVCFLIGTERGVSLFILSHFCGFFPGGTEQDDSNFLGKEGILQSRAREGRFPFPTTRHVERNMEMRGKKEKKKQKKKKKKKKRETDVYMYRTIIYPLRLLSGLKRPITPKTQIVLPRYSMQFESFNISNRKNRLNRI